MFKHSLWALILISATTFGSVDPDMVRKIKDAINPQVGTRVQSTVVGIFDHGDVEFLTFGEARTDSIFEIGSITKTFTSLLFSMAIDRGLVTADTTLSEIRPEWAGQRIGTITLLQLATHRSGLMRLPCNLHYQHENNPYSDYTEQDLIEGLTDASIDSLGKCIIKPHPTAEMIYSNWGAALLGYAVSVRAGMTYQQILKAWVTDPLGMKDTVVDLNPEQKTRLLQGFSAGGTPTPPWDRLILIGNGALRSTANDMMIYAKAMLRPDETPFASAIRRVENRQINDISYNWFMTSAGSIWHDGIVGGYSSLIKVYLKKDFAVFDLTNSENELRCLIESVEDEACDPLIP